MKNYCFGKLTAACFLSPIWGGILVAIFVESENAAYEFWINALSVCFASGFLFMILWGATKKDARPVKTPMDSEEKVKSEIQRVLEEDRKRKEDDRRPVSAVLISVEYKQSALEGIGRAAVGDWLFGDAGAFVGAASTPSKATKATFSVKYASGRTGVETVSIKGARFKELSALLHD